MDNDTYMSMSNACMTKEHLDHVKNADYSNLSFFHNGQHIASNKSLHEIAVKVILCLISIFSSLIGNLMVLYTMFVLPKLRKAFSPPTLHLNGMNLQNFALNKYSKRAISTTNVSNIDTSQKQFLPQQNNSTSNEIVKNINTPPRISSSRRHSSCISNNINQNNLFPAPTVSYKKTVNLFILNLIICDLMIVFWCSWVHMVNSITDRWLLGAFFCSFNTFVQIVSVIAAISTLSIISYERFTGIVCNMKNKLTSKNTMITVICIWIFSSIAAAPVLIYRKQFDRKWLDHVESWCTDDWPKTYVMKIINDTECISSIEEPLRKIYYSFISCVLFFIPIITMSICYCLIIFKLSYKIPGDTYYEKQLLFKRRKNVTVLLIWSIISFALCWSPVQILLLHEAHRESYTEQMPYWFNWVHFLFYLLAYSNSAINPMINSGLHKHYGKGICIRYLFLAGSDSAREITSSKKAILKK